MNENQLMTKQYQRIYLEYAPMLIRFAEKFVSDFFSEDIVHDVFLKFWDKKLYLLEEKELKRMLYVSVRNACIDHLRRLKMQTDLIDQRALELKLEELDFFESADELFMRKDLLDILKKKIAELPNRSQEVFLLAYKEGLKSAEIAERLNISKRTVDNLLYRSLLYLRKNTSDLLFIVVVMKLISKS